MNQHINNEMISKYMNLQTHSHNTIYFEIIMDGISLHCHLICIIYIIQIHMYKLVTR